MTTLDVERVLEERLVQFRRSLHERPELSLEEYETTARIRAFLQEHGIEILNYPLETGVVAIIRGKRPGPCAAIRTDIDALPIVEETGLPFASRIPGKMHACGHDFHTSAVLGAGVLLKQLADEEASFGGSVLLIFQPAEEIGQGAERIIETGVFRDYRVGVIFGEHNKPDLPTGKIGVRAGPLMGSVDEFRIVVHGVGGHAALPDQTVDPILIASHMVTGMQHVVSRAVSPLDSVVVTVGKFHAGTASNVIPPEAVLEGTVRCLQSHCRDLVEQRLREFVAATANAYGGSADVEYRRVLPAVVNDAAAAELVRRAAVSVVGEANVVEAVPTLGGEDFSLYQRKVPGCFFWTGTGKPDGSSKNWHHPAFDVDEAMIVVASRVFTTAVIMWLQEHGLA